jgi:hypothetical protein
VAKKSMIKNPGKENFFLNGRKIVLGWPTRNTSNWCSATGSEIMKSTECLSLLFTVTCHFYYIIYLILQFHSWKNCQKPVGLLICQISQVPNKFHKPLASDLWLNSQTQFLFIFYVINICFHGNIFYCYNSNCNTNIYIN